MASTIELVVNGSKRSVEAEPNQSLLGVLRDDLELTGSKYGCGEGRCGACTVLIDGQAVRSCITFVSKCAGKQITTIEGLEQNGKLHPLQQAFLEAGAMQCGYCTGGMIMAGVALLNKNARRAPRKSSNRWKAISAAAEPTRGSWRRFKRQPRPRRTSTDELATTG